MRLIHAAAAALLCTALAFAGCNSSTSPGGGNGGNVTKTDLQTAAASANTVIQISVNNDVVHILSNPGVNGIVTQKIRAIQPLLRPGVTPREMAMGLRASPARVGVAQSGGSLPTGSYRVISADSSILYSPIPYDGIFVISPSDSNPNDSDSVRVSNVVYHVAPVSHDSTVQALRIDVYAAHPSEGVTDHHVGQITINSTYTGEVPTSFTLGVTLTQLLSFTTGLAADFVHNAYSASFSAQNLRTNNAVLFSFAVQGTGDLLNSGTFTPTSATWVTETNNAGTDWKTTMNFTNIFIDTSSTTALNGPSLDSATVTGDIKRNSVEVATIAGALRQPFPPATCAPITVTILATGQQVSICDIYPDLFDFGSGASAPRRFISANIPGRR